LIDLFSAAPIINPQKDRCKCLFEDFYEKPLRDAYLFFSKSRVCISSVLWEYLKTRLRILLKDPQDLMCDTPDKLFMLSYIKTRNVSDVKTSSVFVKYIIISTFLSFFIVSFHAIIG